MLRIPRPRLHVTNRQIAERLGVTHAAVSRLRTGTRGPSYDLMVRIAKEFNWPVAEQFRIREEGQDAYAEQLEQVIADRWDQK